MRVLRYGDRAVLVEVESPVALRERLLGTPGVEELVPAARTLLVRFDPALTDPGTLEAAIEAAVETAADGPADPGPSAMARAVTLAVCYDGADLDAVAASTDCSVEAVIARHLAGEYRVAFCGFAPGFAYLTGLDPRLQVPRHERPRPAVPGGSVGLAGEYTAAYPRPSPGGWQLIGRTDAALWDLERADPALLTPGTRVRFEAHR